MKVAIIAITGNGARIGADLQGGIPDSRLFVIERHATEGALPFSESVSELTARLWSEYRGFVFIMATGIVVRCIAGLVKAKDQDPAVVTMDDAGRFAVSLLSGHLGGANSLAQLCADLTGAVAVITTATDANDLPSFDMLAKERGWVIEDLSRVKLMNALLLEGKEIAVVDRGGAVRDYFAGRGTLSFHEDFARAVMSGAKGQVVVSNRILPRRQVTERTLLLRPRDLFLGIGCNRGTSAEEIASVVTGNMERLALSMKSVNCVATARAKEDEEGLIAFAGSCGLEIVCFESEELNGIEVPSPPSAHALAAIGANGVAEPAALLASRGGRLLVRKIKQGNVTLAIAEAGNQGTPRI